VLYFVRVISGGKTTVGGFDFFLGGIGLDFQNRIGIPTARIAPFGGIGSLVICRLPGFIMATPGASSLYLAAIKAPEQKKNHQIVQPAPTDHKIRNQITRENNIKKRANQI